MLFPITKLIAAQCLFLLMYCAAMPQQHKFDSSNTGRKPMLADTARILLLLNKGDSLIKKKRSELALGYVNEASSLSSQLDYEFGKMRSNFLSGKIYDHKGKGDSSKHFFVMACKDAQRRGDSAFVYKCLEQIASLYKYGLLFNNDSMIYYYKLLLHFPTQKDSSALNQLYLNVGYSYYLRSIVDSGLKYVFLSLQLAEKRKDTSTIILSLCGRSAIWNATQHYTPARQAVDQAINLFNEDSTTLPDLYLLTQITKGWIYERSKNYDSLFSNSSQLLPLVLKMKDQQYTSLLYYRQAVYYNSINQPDKALELLQNSLQGSSLEDINFHSCAYREMGRSFVLKGLTTQAVAFLDKSIESARKIHDPGELMQTYELLWQLYLQEQMYESAIKAYVQYNRFKDSISSMHNIASMNLLSTQYEFEKKEDEIKLLSSENKLKTALAQKENQRKNFALTGIAVIALVGGYGFYWFRKKKKLQNEQNLMNERLRISRELHDEVGATLSGVSMYSHLTKTQLQSQDLAGVESSLNIMQDSSAQMVNKLNDIVWLINPDKSSLPDLIQKLEEYARKMAAAKNMEVKTDIVENIHQHQLTMEQRRNIYLFCKEAINNAVKYSEGTLLELSVKDEGSLMKFVVRDNGKGFDPQNVKKGNGSANLQQRAEEIGAAYKLFTSEGSGCTVSLQFKLS